LDLCLSRFALEEGVLCLARIFQRFELRLDEQRHQGPLDLRMSEWALQTLLTALLSYG
jgi:hypothetical protein